MPLFYVCTVRVLPFFFHILHYFFKNMSVLIIAALGQRWKTLYELTHYKAKYDAFLSFHCKNMSRVAQLIQQIFGMLI